MLGLALISTLLIGLNAFFVVMEFALVKLRPSRLEMLVRQGSLRALKVQAILGRLDDYLAASQVGITVISLALGWLAEPALAAWVRKGLESVPVAVPAPVLHGVSFALALAGLAWLHIVIGELVPRSIGIQLADRVALWGAYPLEWFTAAFRLPIGAMSHSSVAILKLLGFKPAAEGESAVSEEELRILLGETQERGSLPLERMLLLENLFDLGSAKVSEAMVARDKIAFLSLKRPWAENMDTIRARRYSRYPLCEDDLETVVGYIHVKDLLLQGVTAAPDLRALRRDLPEVRESDPLEKHLKVFPDKGTQMALVRDAQGRVSGLVTFEDMVEELVGEVHDEFDLPEAWSLTELLVPQAVAVQMLAPDRRSAISQLLGKLCAAVPGVKEEEAFALVWDREMKFSSAVGRGVAVPHGRVPGLERPLVALARFAKPVPFPSPDTVPIRLIFLILTPAATPVVQLKVLGRIAALVTNENLRRKLLRAKTAESLLEIMRTADTMMAP